MYVLLDWWLCCIYYAPVQMGSRLTQDACSIHGKAQCGLLLDEQNAQSLGHFYQIVILLSTTYLLSKLTMISSPSLPMTIASIKKFSPLTIYNEINWFSFLHTTSQLRFESPCLMLEEDGKSHEPSTGYGRSELVHLHGGLIDNNKLVWSPLSISFLKGNLWLLLTFDISSRC